MTLLDTPEVTPPSKGKKRKGSDDDDERETEATPSTKKGKRGRMAPFGLNRGKTAAATNGKEDDAETLPSGGSSRKNPLKVENEDES